MHRRPLHRHIALLQQPRLARIKPHLNLTLQHNPIIQALGTMHHRQRPRRKVHEPTHRPVGIDQSEIPRGFDPLVFFEVGVIVEVRGKFGSRVGYGEGHCAVLEGRPFCWVLALDDGFAGGVVAGDVAGDAWEGRKLAWVCV